MTLIVGVRCQDGVVLAADQQATHGVFGAPTIGQPVEKIRLLGTNVLLGIPDGTLLQVHFFAVPSDR